MIYGIKKRVTNVLFAKKQTNKQKNAQPTVFSLRDILFNHIKTKVDDEDTVFGFWVATAVR